MQAQGPAALLNSSPLPTRLLQGWSERSADAPSKAHDFDIEEAQHFRKMAVKSVFGEVWFSSDCRRDIMYKVAVKNSCFGCLKTDGSYRLVRSHYVGGLPDGLDSLTLTYSLFAHTAGTCSIFCYKIGRGGSNRTCKTSAIMSKGDYSFEAQCSLPGLTTAASAHQADQSLPDQSFTKHHGTKSPLGRLGQSSCIEALQGGYKL